MQSPQSRGVGTQSPHAPHPPGIGPATPGPWNAPAFPTSGGREGRNEGPRGFSTVSGRGFVPSGNRFREKKRAGSLRCGAV